MAKLLNKSVVDYYSKVANKLDKAIEQSELTISEIIDKFKSKYDIDITQSTISKIRSNSERKSHISLGIIVPLCEILGLNISTVLSCQETSIKQEERINISCRTFITNPQDSSFKGYVGCTFRAFFLNANQDFMQGSLSFENFNNNYCFAKFIVNHDDNMQPVKIYTGELLIAAENRIAYCILVSEILHEFCYITFNYSYLPDKYTPHLAVITILSDEAVKKPITGKLVLCNENAEIDGRAMNLIKDELDKAEVLVNKNKEFLNMMKHKNEIYVS